MAGSEGSGRDDPGLATTRVTPDDNDAATLNRPRPEVSPTLPRGASLGHYLVVGELGHGGMSVVYRAYDVRLQREVALKVVRTRGHDPQASARMLREARAMAQLAHPNVVPVYDAGNTEGTDWVAMELVTGAHLSAWLDRAPRPWPQIAATLLEAGQGLAAAHQKGLVHRDFKPTNILIGDDGRARVTDFGLARAIATEQADDVGAATPREAVGPLAEPLTRRGAIMGTLPYMPPEQYGDGIVDARSDQFAFCVTAWEALFGQRPFPDALEDGRAAKLAHRVPPPPTSHVPSSIRDALTRGLHPEPAARFESMAPLLRALDVAPRRVARWLALGAAGTAIAATIAIMPPTADDGPLCSGGPARAQEVWNDTRVATIAEAFSRAAEETGPTTWTQVAATVEQYRDAWLTAYRETCEATAVHGRQTAEVLDLRTACLDDRLQELDAILVVLADADATVVQRAPRAVRGLSPLSACGELAYLRAKVAPPPDAKSRADVEALRQQLRLAMAEENLGRYDAGVALTDVALRRARQIDYDPITAQLLRRRGNLAMQRGRFADAIAPLREAFFVAAGARDDEVAARSAMDLSFAMSREDQGRDALGWLQHAHMLAQAAELPVEFEARRADRLGAVLSSMGREAEALTEHRRALALYETVDEQDLGTKAQYEMHLAMALADDEAVAEAEDYYQRSLAHHRSLLGSAHPDVGIVLLNYGSLLRQTERHDAAISTLVEAKQIFVRALGEEHTFVGSVNNSLAIAHASASRWDEAVAFAEQAIEIHARAHGPEHVQTGWDWLNLGTILLEAKRSAAARDAYRQAERIGSAHNPEHALAVEARQGLADAGPSPG